MCPSQDLKQGTRRGKKKNQTKRKDGLASLFSCELPANTHTQSLIVPDGSLRLGKARGLPRWENSGYIYTAKAFSWKTSQATQPSSTEKFVSTVLKANLFSIRVYVFTLHNYWPLSSTIARPIPELFLKGNEPFPKEEGGRRKYRYQCGQLVSRVLEQTGKRGYLILQVGLVHPHALLLQQILKQLP